MQASEGVLALVETIGRTLAAIGILLVFAGGLLFFWSRLGLPSLPGDISFSRGNLRIFIPLGTSLLLSIILTIVLNLLFRR
jgi:hypothetical protein